MRHLRELLVLYFPKRQFNFFFYFRAGIGSKGHFFKWFFNVGSSPTQSTKGQPWLIQNARAAGRVMAANASMGVTRSNVRFTKPGNGENAIKSGN